MRGARSLSGDRYVPVGAVADRHAGDRGGVGAAGRRRHEVRDVREGGRGMTPEAKAKAIEKVVSAAVHAAWKGPGRRAAMTAGIPWDALELMREGLDELGIDWRGMRERSGLPKAKP